MAELITVARPYARAAFEYAKSTEQLSLWSQWINLTALVVQEDKVQKMISAPLLDNNGKANVLLDICGIDSIGSDLLNFIRLLSESKRLVLLPQIAQLFNMYLSELESKVKIKVSSAFSLTAEQTKSLTKNLKKRLNQDVDLDVIVDKTLIGGLVINVGNLVIDGSIRGKLAKLNETLKSHF